MDNLNFNFFEAADRLKKSDDVERAKADEKRKAHAEAVQRLLVSLQVYCANTPALKDYTLTKSGNEVTVADVRNDVIVKVSLKDDGKFTIGRPTSPGHIDLSAILPVSQQEMRSRFLQH